MLQNGRPFQLSPTKNIPFPTPIYNFFDDTRYTSFKYTQNSSLKRDDNPVKDLVIPRKAEKQNLHLEIYRDPWSVLVNHQDVLSSRRIYVLGDSASLKINLWGRMTLSRLLCICWMSSCYLETCWLISAPPCQLPEQRRQIPQGHAVILLVRATNPNGFAVAIPKLSKIKIGVKLASSSQG